VKKTYLSDCQSVGKGFTRWSPGPRGWDEGEFLSPQGIVSIYMQKGHPTHTRLDFVYGGRLYIRTWKRKYSRRTIPRLARAFVRDVAGAP